MKWPLLHRIPPKSPQDNSAENLSTSDLILDRFLEYVKESNLELYPAQEEAILELISEKNVILNTPTGSGKSLVALAVHFQALSLKRRSIYTCPVKALVNEKFIALCRVFGPEQVGLITGDASVNPQALILCCTAEILANDALRQGSQAPIGDVILDEFHYYSDRERGVAWQIPLLTLPQARFLLMSATLGDTRFLEEALTRLTGRPAVLVQSKDRPVPLLFEYRETPIHETVANLVTQGRAPIYVVNFTQRECAEGAQNFLSTDFCTKDEKKKIQAELEGFRFSSPYGKELQKLVKHGIGLHHAGLLPKYRLLVEKLAQKGLLKLICGTDTLGVGVNIPIRSVLFTKLCKFDGQKTGILSVRDFLQISGRAGRKGYDHEGYVVAQAPEHVIENLRLEQKATGDPKKLKKMVKRKPPEKGFVMWTRETFERLMSSEPEPLVSRFRVSQGMLLNVLSRPNEDSCQAMRELIRHSHEPPTNKRQLGKTAFKMFRALKDRNIIELNPLRVNVDLQEDFSLNHALSLYLIDTLHLLDPNDPEYALDLLTLVESILENPDLILRRQLDKIKTIQMNEMKLNGVEYDDRIAKLEELEYPKPNRDFIYDTFNDFAAAHPWIVEDTIGKGSTENIRPKSIAREMFEGFYSFSEYIREYGLQRSEGLLLRYLFDTYRVLVQTVPKAAKNEEVEAIEIFFGTLVRSVDSSLIDEWERMKNPNWLRQEVSNESVPGSPSLPGLPGLPGLPDLNETLDITRNTKAFTILVRNEIFEVIRALSNRDYPLALSFLEHSWTPLRLEKVMDEYYASNHFRLSTDTKARSAQLIRIQTHDVGNQSNNDLWHIEQILADPDGLNDWSIRFTLSLEQSRNQEKPVLQLVHLGPLEELVGT